MMDCYILQFNPKYPYMLSNFGGICLAFQGQNAAQEQNYLVHITS